MTDITILPSRERFAELAKLGNVVPVFVDLVADGETPASAFQKLDEGGYSFLFESAEQTEQSGRYSFLGFSPRLTISSEPGAVSIEQNGRAEKRETNADPLRELERIARPAFISSRNRIYRASRAARLASSATMWRGILRNPGAAAAGR